MNPLPPALNALTVAPLTPRLSPLAPRRRLRGLSLLEVLIAIGILLFGLLGVAALIPVGILAVQKVEKSDRTGMCGRAALREVKVRGLLNYNNWFDATNHFGSYQLDPTSSFPTMAFLIDPLGYANFKSAAYQKSLGGVSGATAIPRFSCWNSARTAAITSAVADPIFYSRDDLLMVLPENQTVPVWQPLWNYVLGSMVSASNGHWYRCTVAGISNNLPPSNWPTNLGTVTEVGGVTWQDIGAAAPSGSRPWGLFVQTNNTVNTNPTSTPASQGNCSWFLTVSPVPGETNLPVSSRTAYNVSAVVCYGRGFQTASEHVGIVSTDAGSISGGIGGVTVTLDSSAGSVAAAQNISTNQWVLLVRMMQSGNVAAVWYRVVSVGDLGTASAPKPVFGLVGPDWDVYKYSSGGNLVAIDGVTGVYSATIPVEK